MFDESVDITVNGGDGGSALIPTDPEWRPIFHASNQVVLYNPTSHAIAIRTSTIRPPQHHCPYCKQSLPNDFHADPTINDYQDDYNDPQYSRASNYFHLLAVSNETWSRPSTPPAPIGAAGDTERTTFSPGVLADGYFKAFFREEQKLGMGANGSVYLCQHLLDGNPLGHFAVKKVAVGESHEYLVNILREVRLLERFHHPNIITYHHSWLESTQFSAFGPVVPTLHILMQWAEGGSLDDFIDARLGRETHTHITPSSPDEGDPDLLSRSARIRAYKMFQKASPEEKERLRRRMDKTGGKYSQTWTAVHLLSAEEAKSLFGDVVEGLAFLHSRSILHLDLKPGNVLLTWDEGRLIPRAMLSDFGTSRDMMNMPKVRSGNTGTLEYTAPESLPSPQTGTLHQIDSKADMWSLGMILHKLLFFKLPYHYAASGDGTGSTDNSLPEHDKMARLEAEVQAYPGWRSTSAIASAFEARSLPRTYIILLENLLMPLPTSRPSCEKVLTALREGKLDPVRDRTPSSTGSTSLIPLVRRHSDSDSSADRTPTPTPAIDAVTYEAEETLVREVADEKTSFLSLPPPLESPPPWNMNDLLHSKLVVRTLKSSVLVMKIMHISSLHPTRHWGTMALALAIILAVTDTWFEPMWTSVVFGVAHILIVKLA